jgi:hypothetical protein
MGWDQRWLPWRNFFWLLRHSAEAVAALRKTFERSASQGVEVA